MMYNYPFDAFKVTCKFGVKGTAWKAGYHSGLDLVSVAAGGDGLVHPIAEGKVLKTGYSAAYGNYVSVSHPDGYISLYAHLKVCLVAIGQPVTVRSALGYEGSTGNASGRHLHLEIHKGEYAYPATIDPEKFIEERMLLYTKLPIMHSVTIQPSRFRVIKWGKGKRTSEIKNYGCAPFQASGTVPVGNVIADGVKLSEDPNLSTLWVNADGSVGFGKTPPPGARNALSGLPLYADGKLYTLGEALAEGWDTSPLYPTTHAIIGYGGDGLLHYYVFNSEKTGAAACWEELQSIAVSLGMKYALLVDGGGSTILDIDGTNKIASAGNRQLATLIQF